MGRAVVGEATPIVAPGSDEPVDAGMHRLPGFS